MGWKRAEKKDFNELISFLIEREWHCVSFTSYLNLNGRSIIPSSNKIIILVNRNAGEITGAVLLTSNGLIFPVFNHNRNISNLEKDELIQLIRKSPLRQSTIMGLKDDIKIIENGFIEKSKININYFIMTKNNLSLIPPHGYKGIKVKKASVADAADLFPLQQEYEKEEVLVNNMSFNYTFSYKHFQSNLKTQIIYYAEKNNIPVAKAGTNALGFTCYQIGGVYTIKELRCQGISSYLMKVLLNNIAEKNKNAVLFVKCKNIAAINMYTNIGFNIQGDFRITYLR